MTVRQMIFCHCHVEDDVDASKVDDVNRIMAGAGAYEVTTKEV
ncbi:MAG: hypothetical protein R3B47_20450 [Bacteroidia bacterium]